MSHVFKKVAPRHYSPVELVTKYGDAWAAYLPYYVRTRGFFVWGPDHEDAKLMGAMERGSAPRVET